MTVEKSSWLKGNLDIRTRADGSGGNLSVAADAEIGGDIYVEGGLVFPDGPALSPDGIDRGLLPLATDSEPGAVTAGAGLAVDDGTLSWAPQYKTLGSQNTVSGGGAYICVEANALEIDIGGSEAVIRVKVKSSGGIAKSASGLAADKNALQTILELTDAARTEIAAGTGTAADSGKIPVLDAGGKIPFSLMPARVIGGENLGKVANEESMILLSQATSGDFCFRMDEQVYYMLGSAAEGAYSDPDNWIAYTGAVTSVNGQIGNVTQAALGMVTTVAASSNTSFPTCKATADYFTAKIAELDLGGTYATVSALNSAINGLSETYATIDGVDSAIDALELVYAKLTDLAGYSETGHQHLTAPDTTVPASGVIVLEQGKIHYSKSITGNTVIGFDASGLNTADVITFELLIKMSATVYQVLFGSNVTWLNGDEPLFNAPNTSFLCAFRSYNGGDSWVGAYQGQF